MNNKVIHKVFAAVAFLVSFVQFAMTVQPSVPFWDCGEFSAAAAWQQVPHPPGAPLFLAFGKLFQLIIPFGDIGWRINMESVFVSAVSVLLLYLITVKVINAFRKEGVTNLGSALMVYGSAFVGALAFSFSDTFWFNGVESEVYASSTVFVALIIYLMMLWYEKADEKGHERYLLLIGYIIGLSSGVHLLSILTIFTLAMVIYYRKYEYSHKSFAIMTVIGVVAFFIVYPGIIIWLPGLLSGSIPIFKTAAGEHIVDDSTFVTFITCALIIAALIGIFYTKRPVAKMACFVLVSMILGYSTYMQVLVRSHANPPMNENRPKDFKILTSYLGREQYGDAPNWPRRYKTEDIFVREHQKYGKWYAPSTKRVERKDGSAMGLPEFKKVDFMGELNYMFKYQMYDMYWRYFLWNFAGRTSDVQGADFMNRGGDDLINYNNGYAKDFPINFYLLPLIFGFIGLYFHFAKDKKLAFSYLILFLIMGVLAALQQNQQNPQPRERDYFYVGSFMVFAMWIGLGVYALVEKMMKAKENTGLAGGIVLASLVLVPINMAIGGWKMHDRSGNYLPFDQSYNMLQSAEKDAIIFTNGDNDTFPVWWLQDVAGVRRDVRIINLMLSNTLWYDDELKNEETWGAKKVPLSFSDESLRADETSENALKYDLEEAQNIEIPVDKAILSQYTNDPEILNQGKVKMTIIGQPYGEREGKKMYLMRVQDKMVMDILKQVRFTRPVYFSTTLGPDAECGLQSYFRLEGMMNRVCPVPQNVAGRTPINMDVMEKCLMHVDNSDNYSKEPKYGFKFRNLNNMSVFFDETHRRYLSNYRQLYIKYALALLDAGEKQKATAALDMMNQNISLTQFPVSYALIYNIADMYDRAGATAQANQYAKMAIEASSVIAANPAKYAAEEPYMRQVPPEVAIADCYALMKDYNKARQTISGYILKQRDEQTKIRLQFKMDQYFIDEPLRNKDTAKALIEANKLIEQYDAKGGAFKTYLKPSLENQIRELNGEKQPQIVENK